MHHARARETTHAASPAFLAQHAKPVYSMHAYWRFSLTAEKAKAPGESCVPADDPLCWRHACSRKKATA